MIVIPMAGLSSRFFKAGYEKPKYMLEAHGKTLFEHSVQSFSRYFDSIPFLFITRNVFDTKKFVQEKAQKLGIRTFYIVELNSDTRGQADTVFLGLTELFDQDVNIQGSITVFNIDTFRPGFTFPDEAFKGDGYLEVFEGSGDNWSFAKPISDNDTQVAETAEKRPISNLCSTGLYHFSSVQDFLDAFQNALNRPKQEWEKGELYIAPMYNTLIAEGKSIHYHKIDPSEVIFCGVPDEYTDFLKKTLL
ncbi:glycosyltransferase family 2 protein [Vibrio salinus]|uniref:glycosyltransferase family 2 protein n=1 Tax=Vibrio salinus TaxID=2899784 RepID=UPI001E5C5ABB|nr:glycosyltransferase family 2 protein [Vibrio salinus]MCE0493749.1 glycosyltransferase family 2 protein [Vibrio salinus]